MLPNRKRTTRKTAAGLLPFPLTRVAVSALFVAAVAGAWLAPARAQEQAPAPAAPAVQAPAAPAPAAGEQETTSGEHGVDAPSGHGEAAHGKEAGHEEAFSLHLPTWLYRPLILFWSSGPATVAVNGAATAEGAAVQAAELVGKQVELPYHPHGSKLQLHLKPTIASVGGTQLMPGVSTEKVTIDGREILLISPTIKLTLEGMFPEALVISLLTALCILLVALWMSSKPTRIPGKKQMLAEIIYTALDGFVHGLIGPHYKRYVPLVGTAFIYILTMNLAGLIPGWTSPTANINITAGLALVVVVYVQYEGIRVNGFLGYLKHFVGEPWWLAGLNVPIHVIGEFAKLLSLTIRLFGNIFGEDVVIVILIALAGKFTAGYFPAQAPMYLLAIFTSFVQAMVFSILTCVYIALMTTHDDHGQQHAGHAHDGGHGAHPTHVPDAAAHAA